MNLRYFFCFAAAVFTAVCTNAQVVTNLHSFAGFDSAAYGAAPEANVVLAGTTLYGTASSGGTNGAGTIFRVKTDGTGFTVLYNFTGGDDGGIPLAGLVLSNNLLFGTTSEGGAGATGTIFKISTNGTGFATIYTFSDLDSDTGTNTDGATPLASLLMSGNTLFGTTSEGGAGTTGTVFKVNLDGSSFTTLHNFDAIDPYTYINIEGAQPACNLLLAGSTLFGTTLFGGTNSTGTIFKVNTNGAAFGLLYTFKGNVDGANSSAGLILSGSMLYGVTPIGGTNYAGNIFKINTNGNNFVNLYNFSGDTDGANPASTLLLSGTTLYGTSPAAGLYDNGTVFQISTTGAGFTVLHTFADADWNFETNADGAAPLSSLILSGATLYGTTSTLGPAVNGTVFKMSTAGASFDIVTSFAVPAALAEGHYPMAGLVVSGNTLYGTTLLGGAYGSGTIFKVNLDGTGYSTLYNFSALDPVSSTNGDGASPTSALLVLNDTLYGTAPWGGLGQWGTVFKITTNGTGFVTLHSFSLPDSNYLNYDGIAPAGKLAGFGSNLFGVTQAGGANGQGTIFKIGTNGAGFTVLHTFPAAYPLSGSGPDSLTNADGAPPLAGLILGGNTLYGTAWQGGPNGIGTIFSLGVDGARFTVLHTFNGADDGAQPQASLTLSGSTLFGTSASGGIYGDGTIFKLNTNGSGFTVLYSFPLIDDFSGSGPLVELILSGTTLYGTTCNGGEPEEGTVFQINTDGTGYTPLYDFDTYTGGGMSEAGLVLAGNFLFGTMETGGANNDGSVFDLNLKIAPVQLLIRSAGPNVVLTWANPFYALQSATTLQGAYTNLTGSTTPYTNSTSGGQKYFRLHNSP